MYVLRSLGFRVASVFSNRAVRVGRFTVLQQRRPAGWAVLATYRVVPAAEAVRLSTLEDIVLEVGASDLLEPVTLGLVASCPSAELWQIRGGLGKSVDLA